jgi:hypothetical protein
MYLTSILFYLTWPVLIIASYWLITLVLKRYEKIPEAKQDEPELFISD